MTIKLKTLTLRNFLSIGNVTQSVDFARKNLTLIIGENADLGGNGSRNGVGKTALIQALSYVLYGEPINRIRIDNLVNRTNLKNMIVTLTFSIGEVDYKIERGRKPSVFKFYVDNQQQKVTNDAQGESKETQAQITKLLNMSHEMFKQIIALNTYTDPFLAMKAGDQREIIEQLLGVTLLSEKADALREQIKDNKLKIQQEEFKIKSIEEVNKKVKEQISNLKLRQTAWLNKKNNDLTMLLNEYETLSKIDFDAELQAHKDLAQWKLLNDKKVKYDALLKKHLQWKSSRDSEIETLQTKLNKLLEINIEAELNAHTGVEAYTQRLRDRNEWITKKRRTEQDVSAYKSGVEKLLKELIALRDHKCHACGQDLHDSKMLFLIIYQSFKEIHRCVYLSLLVQTPMKSILINPKFIFKYCFI
jgi:DNA repair exonuclease SbcCD ATPase subunit